MRRSHMNASATLAIAAILTTAACSTTSARGGTTQASGIPPIVQAHYDAGLKGSYANPETSTKPAAGKKITAIVFGNQSAASPIYEDAVKAAAGAAGWSVNVVDGQFSSSAQISAIQQAVSQKVDGIALFVIDCASIKAAAQQAKAAAIPIVYAEGRDCGAPGSKDSTGYPLGTPNGITGEHVEYYPTYLQEAGALEADAAIIAKKGHVNALAVNFPESDAVAEQTNGFVKEMTLCTSCTTKVLNLTFADFGSTLQQKVSTALLQNPNVNTVFGNYDDPVVNGITAAVQSSGRTDIYITGEAGYPAMLQAIRDGKAQMTVGYDVGVEGWDTVERFNRIFHGDTGTYFTGLGLQIITADHNLPASGQQYTAPIDYAGTFKKVWTGK